MSGRRLAIAAGVVLLAGASGCATGGDAVPAASAPAPAGTLSSPTVGTSPSRGSPLPSSTVAEPTDGLGLYAGTEPATTPRGTVRVGEVRTADGLVRTYRLFVPEGGLGVAPLLVVLHGGLGSGEQAAANTGFDGLATSNRFLVVYPDGVGRLPDGSGGARTWNGGACCGSAAARGIDDVSFVRAVVRDVAATHAVDPNRLYLAGHSNGGILALRLACEQSRVFAAVGVQAAALGVEGCSPPRPVSLMQIHGSADANIPLAGGRGSGISGATFPPPRGAALAFASSDDCATRPTSTVDTTNPDLRLEQWQGCARGTAVQFLTVIGAGHAWMGHPSTSPAAARLVGLPYPDLDASRAIWSFLAAHPRQ